MATQTLEFARFADGQVRVELDLNSANWKVLRVRCINDSAHAVSARILELGAEVYSVRVEAGQTESWNVSGVQLGWQPDYWNDLTETWEPGGLELGDYTIATCWPAGV